MSDSRSIDTEILIIGGGLSGLSLADHLTRAGQDWRLVEARPRLGGRIAGLDHGDKTFDLGPAWFWPEQPRIAALAKRFGINVFEQHTDGETCYENADGSVYRVKAFSAMAGSLRLSGGMPALVNALASALDRAQIRLNAPVEALALMQQGVEAVLEGGETIRARKVVLALPPRIAAGIVFDPPLPEAAMRALTTIPTWMGAMAKCVAVYERPFWRDAGFSGDAMSRHGPMIEIHDASAMDGAPGALFGFLGVPALHRLTLADELGEACIAQFGRLFGEKAHAPLALHLADWAAEPFTATEADHLPLGEHPAYGPPPALSDLWGGALSVAVTETAPEHGGFTEGALSAAEAMAQTLIP